MNGLATQSRMGGANFALRISRSAVIASASSPVVLPITRVDIKTILVKLDGKKFAKPGKAKFKLSIDVRKLKAGAHKLIIRASDKFKNGSVSITDFVRC